MVRQEGRSRKTTDPRSETARDRVAGEACSPPHVESCAESYIGSASTENPGARYSHDASWVARRAVLSRRALQSIFSKALFRIIACGTP